MDTLGQNILPLPAKRGERKFPLLNFSHLEIVKIYLMTVARKWPAPSSTLHLALVATLTAIDGGYTAVNP
jgi:hypothetical protein